MKGPLDDGLTFEQVQQRIKEFQERAVSLRRDIEDLAVYRVFSTRTSLQEIARLAYRCSLELEALHIHRDESRRSFMESN